jgi:flagellar M-ring protein FliF
LLYSSLDPAEAGRIGQRLDEMKVPFENRGDGTTILVPASQVGRVRMDLAASGMPRQGGSGYELLDTQSPMSMTSFMQRVQRLRALEGELARTITTMDGVKTARVHIVMPERESFAREAPKPTASVAVSMYGPARLPSRQAMAIRLLVAGAVPGLKQDAVSVLDPSGVVLAADDAEVMASSRLEDMKTSREQALQRTLAGLLEPLVGAGHVRTAVSLEVDASREVSREEKYDPNSQVERSKIRKTIRKRPRRGATSSRFPLARTCPIKRPRSVPHRRRKMRLRTCTPEKQSTMSSIPSAAKPSASPVN